jgi:hypothetical protein
VECANCRKTSAHDVLMSTNAVGSSDLDLRPPPMQRWTMDCWLHECPHCGYVAGDLARPAGESALVGGAEYRAILNDRCFPELARRFMAHALLFRQAEPSQAGHSLLHAAWSCDDANRQELATECRMKAADAFSGLKPFANTEAGVTQGALLVDVLRRAREFAQASQECTELLEQSSAQGILRQVLAYQSRLIAAKDAATHTVEEAANSTDRP